MKKFKVGVVLEQGGYSIIEANTKEEAEKKMLIAVEEDEESAIQDVTHRAFYTIDCEEVKE
jgi:hypothetical protein